MKDKEWVKQRIVNLRVILGSEEYTLLHMPRETDADNDHYLERRTEIAVIRGKIEELLTVLGERF